MKTETAIILAMLMLLSNYACYKLGQASIVQHYRDLVNRRRERESRWSEFEDED